MRRYIKIVFLLFMVMTSVSIFAGEADPDVSETLFHHVLNGNELDIFPFLAAVNLPFGISVHQLMLFISVILISVFFLVWIKKGDLKPRKRTIILETLFLFVRDDVVYPVMGEERGERWLPFFATQFIFLLVVDLLGLIPAFKTATGNINVTSSMALMIFILTFIVGLKELGIWGFFKNLYPEGTALPIGIFVAILEFVSIITKSMVLSLRLFANMFAGHLAILSFLVLLFVINPFFGFIAVPFAVFTFLLEVLVAFLQAFVFTLLSCIFIMMASTPEGE